MATQTVAPSERGFSLIELLEVIVITLIVTGAIYGLLSQGQHAFRREPEISDRQQQIRVAMDLIQRDLTTAGMAMPEWFQVFATGLNGVGPPNAQGVNSDFLEMIAYDGACVPVSLCPGQAVGPTTIVTNDPLGACYRFTEAPPEPMLVMTRPSLGPGPPVAVANTATIVQAESAAPGGPGGCWGSTVTITTGPGSWDVTATPGTFAGSPPDMKPIQIVRYEIAVDANGIPSLWRSKRGGRLKTSVTTYVPAPTGGSDWQLVATGIEDLQVQYRNGNELNPASPDSAVFVDVLPPIAPTAPGDLKWATIVREVKVTLTGRTIGQASLQGESYSVTGVSAIRGDLTSVTSPRAALYVLSEGPQPPGPNPPKSPQRWY